MSSNIKETSAYTMPVPMSDELGPYGPPKPSGTDHIIRLRNKLTVYESFAHETEDERECKSDFEKSCGVHIECGIRRCH
jgi:hypothetical protein